MTRLSWIVPLAALAACSHRAASAPAAAVPPEPAPAVAAPLVAPAPEPAIAAAARACGGDADCGAAQLCVDSRCTDIVPGLAACRASVHFAFDSASLPQAELAQLQRVARCAVGGASPRVVVEGNADERGTVEYNVALGDRRAAAVASYLERLGVPRGQLQAVSYGKEMPLCTEHTEACWSQNRRAAANAQ